MSQVLTRTTTPTRRTVYTQVPHQMMTLMNAMSWVEIITSEINTRYDSIAIFYLCRSCRCTAHFFSRVFFFFTISSDLDLLPWSPESPVCVQDLDLVLESLAELQRERGGTLHGDPVQMSMEAISTGMFIGGMPMSHVLREELQAIMDAKLAAHNKEGAPPARKGTLRWYIEHKHEPVSSANALTIEEFCYSVVWQKIYSHSINKGTDFMCSWIARGGLLADDNQAPGCASSCLKNTRVLGTRGVADC